MTALTLRATLFIFAIILSSPLFAATGGAERSTAADFTETPDLWTCGAQDWGPFEARCTGMTDRPAEGKYAMALNYSSGPEHYLVFPKWRNANWDLSKTQYIEFKVKLPKGVTYRGANPTLYLRNQEGRFFRIRPKKGYFEKPSDGEWQQIRIPINDEEQTDIATWMDPSLTDIDFFEIAFWGINTPQFCAHYVLVDDVHFGPEQPSYTPPDENGADLDVLIIERDPKYERYDVSRYDKSKIDPNVTFGVCLNKDKKHYPDKGEEVTFTARVQNKGKAPLGGTYAWILDGKEVDSGKISSLERRGDATFTWKWKWDPADHDLTFKITPAGYDYCPNNNALTIRTNAMMLKHIIERGLIGRMESKVNMTGSYSCEDWLQGEIRFMNQLFAESKYPFAPNGITARVMIGKFEYVDDGYLRSICPVGPFQIGEQDLTLDGGRGCTSQDDPWNSGAGAPAFLNFIGRPDDAWLHELSHQLGIIDDYQSITEPGDNKVNGVGYTYRHRGLMGGGEISPHKDLGQLYSYYSPSNVQAFNVTKGKRRGYFGEYLYCVPDECGVKILDENGKALADAEIKMYQTSQRIIDDVQEQEGKTDAKGVFMLKNRPADHVITETGCEQKDNPFGPIHVVGFNNVFLVVTKKDGVERYAFITVYDYNFAWMSGFKKKAIIPLTVRVKKDETHYFAPPLPEWLGDVAGE